MQTSYYTDSGAQNSATAATPGNPIASMLGDSIDLTTNFGGIVGSGADLKVQIRQFTQKIYLTNSSNATLYCQAWYVKCRRDYPNTVATLMADEWPGYSQQWLDPTLGTNFRKHFRIYRRKTYKINPGRSWTMKQNFFYKNGWSISGEADALPTNSPLTSGIIFKFATQPLESSAAGISTVSGAYTVNWIRVKQARWWANGSNDPNQLFNNGAPALAAATVYTDAVATAEAGAT